MDTDAVYLDTDGSLNHPALGRERENGIKCELEQETVAEGVEKVHMQRGPSCQQQTSALAAAAAAINTRLPRAIPECTRLYINVCCVRSIRWCARIYGCHGRVGKCVHTKPVSSRLSTGRPPASISLRAESNRHTHMYTQQFHVHRLLQFTVYWLENSILFRRIFYLKAYAIVFNLSPAEVKKSKTTGEGADAANTTIFHCLICRRFTWTKIASFFLTV